MVDLSRFRGLGGAILVGGLALALATVAAAVVNAALGIADASPVYLLAVVAMASLYGTLSAAATSVLAFLVYDFLFTRPRYTFAVADPQEWLSLLLFLVVAVVIGRLTALQGDRAAEARRRAREAHALFMISRSLATASSVRAAAAEIVDRLRDDAGVDRVWIAAGPTPRQERRLADSAPGEPRPETRLPWILRRTPGELPAEWIRIHPPRTDAGATARQPEGVAVFRVVIEAEGQELGSVWAVRSRAAGLPGRAMTRTLSLAADQIGLALRREQLAAEATSAEVARRSDALKSALLDSVSHDLRTPLATVRALAGSLMDEEVPTSREQTRELAATIDEQAAHLSDLVRNVLDLSRIESGAIRPDLEVHALDELVRGTLQRQRTVLATGTWADDVAEDLPPVLVDALFLDAALANVLENAVRHAPGAPIRIHTTYPTADPGGLDLVVEDGGPGVAEADLGRLFDKFVRLPGASGGRRDGLGIGLTVARGLVEAMGGSIAAERGELGGLAIRIRLPLAPSAAEGDDLPTGDTRAAARGRRS